MKKSNPAAPKSKRGGSNRGQGRKQSERPLKDVHIKLFADQLENPKITNAEIRQAVDDFKKKKSMFSEVDFPE